MRPMNVTAIQEIQALIEVLRELQDIDTLGNGISIQVKLLDRIERLIDTL